MGGRWRSYLAADVKVFVECYVLESLTHKIMKTVSIYVHDSSILALASSVSRVTNVSSTDEEAKLGRYSIHVAQ